MHAYLRTYTLTFVYACMHACMHAYLPTYVHACIHTQVIERFGGVYVDTDFEALKSIDPLLKGLSFFVGT